MNLYRDIRDILCKGYDKGEASAIAFLLLEEVAGMSRTQALMGDPSLRSPEGEDRNAERGDGSKEKTYVLKSSI